MWEAKAQRHQLQSSHNDTNYWLVNGQPSHEDSTCSTIVESRGAQDQSLPLWTCCKTQDAAKGHLTHSAVSLAPFLIHSGPWRLILGDSYTCPTHTFSLPHKPPSEPLSIHLHSRLVDKPRITMWSCLLKAHRHLFPLHYLSVQGCVTTFICFFMILVLLGMNTNQPIAHSSHLGIVVTGYLLVFKCVDLCETEQQLMTHNLSNHLR